MMAPNWRGVGGVGGWDGIMDETAVDISPLQYLIIISTIITPEVAISY